MMISEGQPFYSRFPDQTLHFFGKEQRDKDPGIRKTSLQTRTTDISKGEIAGARKNMMGFEGM